MVYEHKTVREFLKSELETRIAKNPRYSLRAFAKAMGIHAAELSLVLRAERTLSYNSCQKILQNLAMSPSQQKYFVELLQAEKNGINFIESSAQAVGHNLNVERFQKISKWYHFAILNLLETKDFKWTPAFISRRLNISPIEAGLAMQDLTQEGLVQLKSDSTKRKSTKVVSVNTALPSSVIRAYHEQLIGKSLQALKDVPMNLREYQSVGLTVSMSDISEIKKFMDKFSDEFIEKFHKENGTEVYQLQLSFFPLTQPSGSTEVELNQGEVK